MNFATSVLRSLSSSFTIVLTREPLDSEFPIRKALILQNSSMSLKIEIGHHMRLLRTIDLATYHYISYINKRYY